MKILYFFIFFYFFTSCKGYISNETGNVYTDSSDYIDTNKIIIHNIQEVINQRKEEDNCDEFMNLINKKEDFQHIDGTTHKSKSIDDLYIH